MVVDISDNFLFFNVKSNVLVQGTKNLSEQFPTQAVVKIHVKQHHVYICKTLLVTQSVILLAINAIGTLKSGNKS